MNATATTSPHYRRDVWATVRRYARLVKFQFVLDFFLALLVAVTALAVAGVSAGAVWLTVVFFALGQLGVLSAVMTLDDLTGFRDGSDRENYVDAPSTALRPLKRKPLLTGELTVAQARRFGYGGLAWGIGWWAAAVAVSPAWTVWATLLTATLLAASVQYSWGLKLSYHGLGEACLLFSASAFLAAPYGLATGTLPVPVLAQALLFGFGQLLVAGYSNTNDISGDAAAGRRTVAVMASARGNVVFLGTLTLANVAVVVVPVAAGALPAWFALALAPAMLLRLRQFVGFLRRASPLEARARGVAVFRATVAGMVLFNVLAFVLS